MVRGDEECFYANLVSPFRNHLSPQVEQTKRSEKTYIAKFRGVLS